MEGKLTKIRVITEDLLATQKEIIAASLQIAGVAVKLSAIGLLARTYDNNTFGPKVRSICTGSASAANSLRSNIAQLGERLGNFVNKIIAVDGGGVFETISTWWKGIWDNKAGGSESNDTSESIRSGEITSEAAITKKLSFSNIAEIVPFSGETFGNPYDRIGFSGNTRSNCTWYTWEAVFASTGVKLVNWGNASNWPIAAKSSYRVDSNPSPGSILCFGNHVGFVESVEYNSDGSVKSITWSEEQATGKNEWGNSGKVIKEGELRWRVTSSLNYINNKLGTAQFIHVK